MYQPASESPEQGLFEQNYTHLALNQPNALKSINKLLQFGFTPLAIYAGMLSKGQQQAVAHRCYQAALYLYLRDN